MKVSELIDYLSTCPKDAEVFFSLWASTGEIRYNVDLSVKHTNIYGNGQFVRIAWTDDCLSGISNSTGLKPD